MALSRLDTLVLGLVLAWIFLYFLKDSTKSLVGRLIWWRSSSRHHLECKNETHTELRDIAKVVQDNEKQAIFFFGSQTGTAEDFASRLAKEAHSKFGLNGLVADLEDYDYNTLDLLSKDVLCFFVLATYGEGEPTDNAQEFFNFLSDEGVEFSQGGSSDEQPLTNLKYLMFGLGNKTYQNYNKMAIDVDNRLTEMGATRLGSVGLGDDDCGNLEDDFMAWKGSCWEILKTDLGLKEKEAVYEPQIKIKPLPLNAQTSSSMQLKNVFLGEYHKDLIDLNKSVQEFGSHKPFPATVKKSQQIYHDDNRKCLHMEIDFSESNLSYVTGDHLAVIPSNPTEEVDSLLRILDLKDREFDVIDLKCDDALYKIPVPHPTTYRTVLQFYLNICGPVSRDLLISLAQFAPTEESSQKLLECGKSKEKFHQTILSQYLSLPKTLRNFAKSWPRIPFEFLIENVPHIQPRFYSISSSALHSGSKTATITAVIESYKNDDLDISFSGLATNYLMALHQKVTGSDSKSSGVSYHIDGPREQWKDTVKFYSFLRPSHFRLPSNEAPIIMIGCGTGIAPFRGFVQERIYQKKCNNANVGETILFFGCRRRSEDFIFQDTWDEASTILKENFTLYTAFSRENPEKKIYVQDRLKEAEVVEKVVNLILKRRAYLYICGDASKMAVDVNNALSYLLSEHVPEGDGSAYLHKMRSMGRLLEDIWS